MTTRRKAVVSIVVPELVAQADHAPMLGTEAAGGISEDEWIEMMVERDAAGIVFVSGMHADMHANPDRYHRPRSLGISLVLINGRREGVDAGCISADDAAAMRMAVDHLASLEHERIGLAVGPERHIPVIRKRIAFEGAIDRHDLGELPDAIASTLVASAPVVLTQ